MKLQTDRFLRVSLLLLASLPLLAQGSGGDVYKVTLSAPGAMGLTSVCGAETYVLARWTTNGSKLHADGAILDVDGSPGPELFLNLISDIPWTRKYNAGGGLSGVFNGCFGETYPFGASTGYSGNLFVTLEKKGPNTTIQFLWHFAYYHTAGNVIREHFTLRSAKIPFPAWTGGTLSARVSGNFDVEYYLKEGHKIVSSYQSITSGVGRLFAFDVLIQKVP